MSTTYSIGCKKCKKRLWIAQTSSGNRIFYTADRDAMQALGDFLFDHEGHDLVFNSDYAFDEPGWVELPTPELEPETNHALCHSIEAESPVAGSDALSWVETREIHGGIWEIQTPTGEVYRKNLGSHSGLGFYALMLIARLQKVGPKAAWAIAEKSKFYRVESLHGRPQNAD